LRITVVGTGYVGLVTGVCLAHVGHHVRCVDIDAAKVAKMQAGEVPIYEPGLEELFTGVLANGQLTVTTDLAEGVAQTDVIFLALPTPPGADGSADLSAVLAVASQLGPLLSQYTAIVNKSTVPVGTGEQVTERVKAEAKVEFSVVSNPEFLREGLAVQDFMHPDRIVIGTDNERAADVMREVYEPFIDTPEQLVSMDIRSAEMTKYAANSFLAMKISFMNEIANLSEMVGANVDNVRLGIGPDPRIGKQFLRAGIGYGGSCFPKDVQALQFTARQSDYEFKLLDSLIVVNQLQQQRLTDKLFNYFDNDLKGKHIALWGLSFKPDTDDIREAPSLDIIEKLLQAGATVTAYDPQAMDNVKRHFGERQSLNFASSPLEAAKDADALLLITEWEQFREPDFAALEAAMKVPVIFDGRNVYPLEHIQKTNFHYDSIGRPTLN